MMSSSIERGIAVALFLFVVASVAINVHLHRATQRETTVDAAPRKGECVLSRVRSLVVWMGLVDSRSSRSASRS